MDDFTMIGRIAKVDEARRLVFGWASVIAKADGTKVRDLQGDVVSDSWELEKAAYAYVVDSRMGGEMHETEGVATLVESFVSTPEKLVKMGLAPDALPTGHWVGFKVTDDRVWKRVVDGELVAFSIGGSGVRQKVST